MLSRLIGDVVDYFKLLLSFVFNRYPFADLIVNRDFFSIERALWLYVIGIAVSILIPMIVSLGRITPKDLYLFEFIANLPPIISDLTELILQLIMILGIAVFLHVGFMLSGKRGQFWKILLSLIIINAFFQLFDRPFNIFSLFMFEHFEESRSILSVLDKIRWIFLGFFLCPFTYYNYKAAPKTTAKVYGIAMFLTAALIVSAGVAIQQEEFFQEFSSVETTFTQQEENITQEIALIKEEQLALEKRYNEQFVPLLEDGDQKGDYHEASIQLQEIIEQAGVIEQRLIVLKGDAENTRFESFIMAWEQFAASRKLMFEMLNEVMKGEATIEDLQSYRSQVEGFQEQLEQEFEKL